MANNTIKRVWNANKLVSIEDLSGMAFQSESGGHTFEISGTNDSGTAVSLSGTVEARFLRADNVKVTVAGTISSGKASVTLTSNCYTVAGRFSLTIFVTSNSQKVAVYSAVGNVAVTDGVSSGTVPPLVTDSIQTGSMTASGDVTVNGVLDVTNRRCEASLSSAGWYRVCKTADASGTIIDFSICRPYGSTPAEAHRISFYVVGGGKSAFLNETSDTNTLFIDKIRCTYGGGFMYFDVHYNSSASNEVLVYFDVYGKGQANGTSVSMGLTSVADSPSGETVLTEYTFAANTVNHSDTTTSGVRTIVDRNGKLVTVTVEAAGGISCASGQYTTVATLPSWAYPRNTVYPAVDAHGGNNIFAALITTSGDVQLYPVLSNTSYYRLTCTYCTA